MTISSELQLVVARTDGLLAVVVSDKDGAIAVKATRPELPSQVLEPAFTASFLLTSEQMAKIGFGKTNQLISMCGHYCIAQFNASTSTAPFVLTLIAAQDANIGVIVDTGRALRPAVEALVVSLPTFAT
ncbi:Ragulator complex protein LAMTOR3 [Entophlyctis helioformis]|nr:Ragulator complex protein LAMTOR3 [Entophlyctis helioformis]